MGECHKSVTKVDGSWLRRSATQDLFGYYSAAGFRLFAVGGCVRNSLLHRPVSDIDMASDAPPDVASGFLTRAGLRVVPTGIDHGTLTIIHERTTFEVTTFRKDIDTDGRHATVAFSNKIEDDAARRDFTINALYADKDGQVFDPVGGLSDIGGPHIRFIGSAQDRIREDYLRTLRFFRFHAWYAAQLDGFEPNALDAIASNLEGLDQLSRERVGAEMIKLLSASDPSAAVMVMHQLGVLNCILPGAEPKAIGPLIHFEQALALEADPIRRLASITSPDTAKSLRLSKAQMRHMAELSRLATGPESVGEMGYRLGLDIGLGAFALRCAMFEQPPEPTARQEIECGATAKFPIKAKDLSPEYSGLALGEKLRALEADWIASGFRKSKTELLG